MKDVSCDRLDDYLDCHLSEDQRRRFELHLETCRHCQTEVQQQQTLDDAVRQYAATLVPPENQMLAQEAAAQAGHATIQNDKNRSTGSRVVSLLVVAIAASLLLAVGFYISSVQQDQRSTTTVRKPTVPSDPPKPSTNQTPSRRNFPLVSSASHLAVVEQEETDDVTFVMLYPKIDLHQEQDDVPKIE